MTKPSLPKTPDFSRRQFLKRSAITGAAAYGALSLARGVHAAGSDVIKVGLVGCGGRGSGAAANAMNAGKDVRLVAMADLFADHLKDSRQRLKKMYPEQMAVDDDHCFVGFEAYQKVIQSGIDVAVIACTSHFHPVILKAAIDAGKHAFVEKPVAIDPRGVKMAMAAGEDAKKKNLSLVSGFCWRYDEGVGETVKRIRDGQIGEITAVQATRLVGEYVVRPRKPGWNEMQFQLQDWYRFTWLSGSDPLQNLVHQIDNAVWALDDAPPVAAWGVGGRQACLEPKHGDEFDHHGIVYEYSGGKRMFAFGRHIPGCYNDGSVLVMGAKGRAFMPSKPHIEGEKPWRYEGGKVEAGATMYDNEHKVLFNAIRSGKPVNNGRYMCLSAMTCVLGEMACQSGQRIDWNQIMKSDFSYALPRYGWDVEPPAKLGPEGRYPAAIPGITQFR